LSDAAIRSDTPGDAAGGVLVIGYGNTLRSDDGIGWHAASLLADDPRFRDDPGLAGVEVRAVHQLTPELAIDISRVSLVILIDAGADDPPGEISVHPLAPDEDADVPRAVPGGEDHTVAGPGPGATSHHVGPSELLALARALYGTAPAALVVRVGVAEMELGETLSPAVSAALPAVAEVVVGLIARHRATGDAGR
jgi:hydrogenase maturation protease